MRDPEDVFEETLNAPIVKPATNIETDSDNMDIIKIMVLFMSSPYIHRG